MYFGDLTAYSYRLPFELAEVRNVGWLDEGHPFATGKTPDAITGKLRQIICGYLSHADALANVTRGVEPCSLCGADEIEVPCGNATETLLGMAELFIPAPAGYFASPTLILHYIEAHSYLPPQEFMDAITRFDLTKSYNAQDVYDEIVARYVE